MAVPCWCIPQESFTGIQINFCFRCLLIPRKAEYELDIPKDYLCLLYFWSYMSSNLKIDAHLAHRDPVWEIIIQSLIEKFLKYFDAVHYAYWRIWKHQIKNISALYVFQFFCSKLSYSDAESQFPKCHQNRVFFESQVSTVLNCIYLLKYQFWKNVTSEKWNSDELTTFTSYLSSLLGVIAIF